MIIINKGTANIQMDCTNSVQISGDDENIPPYPTVYAPYGYMLDNDQNGKPYWREVTKDEHDTLIRYLNPSNW